MSTDTDIGMARDAGRRLGLSLIRNLEATEPKASMKLATVAKIDKTSCVLDLIADGVTIRGIPYVASCAGCVQGDRVVVASYGSRSVAIGVLARPGKG